MVDGCRCRKSKVQVSVSTASEGWTCDGSPAEALKFSSADATKPGVLLCPAAERPPRAAPLQRPSVSVVRMTQQLHLVKLMLPEIHSNNDKHLD